MGKQREHRRQPNQPPRPPPPRDRQGDQQNASDKRKGDERPLKPARPEDDLQSVRIAHPDRISPVGNGAARHTGNDDQQQRKYHIGKDTREVRMTKSPAMEREVRMTEARRAGSPNDEIRMTNEIRMIK